MAEYIEREALIAAYDKAHKGPPGGARKLMEEEPAADVVPVVRCKDCKRRYTEDCVMQYTYYSDGYSEDGVSVEWTADDDFCSYGERRDSDG